MKYLAICAVTAVLLTGGHSRAQQLLVTETTNRRVMLFDELEGSLLDDSFIDLALVGAVWPTECTEGPDALYISDQFIDSVFMFSRDGSTHLGTITGGMDNIRGICFANGVLYVCNAGTAGGAPGEAIIMFDATGNPLGSFPAGDPFDVLDYAGGLLTTNITTDDIERWDYAGNFLGIFHDSDGVTGIDFPEQVNVKGSTGGILAGGLSTPAGVYEYDSAGTQIDHWDFGVSTRGVHELGNGDIMWTDSLGVHVFDVWTLVVVDVISGVNCRFIQPYGGPEPGTAYCFGDPGVDAPCPCGNDNDGSTPGSGCANGFFSTGARLSGRGRASSITDTLVLVATGLEPNNSGLYFQAENDLTPGSPWGDGLRCAGGGLVRIGVRFSDENGTSDTSGFAQPISARTGNVTAGDTLYYQCWYRSPSGSPCGSGFNLSNGYSVTWTP